MTGDYLGQLAESADGERFGRVAMVELDGSVVTLVLRVGGPGALGREETVAIAPDDEGWRLLGPPPDVPPVAARSCLRCRRLNLGPCISATCLDLQVAG